LNARAAKHGVGRVDLVESRTVGIKSRGVYETPGGTVLYEAVEDLCRLVLPHDLHRTRASLALQFADLVYAGQWFSPLRRALQAFMDNALQTATGTVTVALHQGRAEAVARTSPMSLYRPEWASFNMDGYNAQHAEGFIRLFGLPLAAASQRGGRKAPGSTPSMYVPATNGTNTTPANGGAKPVTKQPVGAGNDR
jgi:argininosuccinate synthase